MRYFYQPDPPVIGAILALEASEARHFAVVLRGQVGEQIGLLDGQGHTAVAEVVEVSGKKHHLVVRAEIKSLHFSSQSSRRICLYVACPRTKQIELILRQATELGVSEIHPIVSEFTISKPDKNPDKWQQALLEAIKQSKNPWLPQLHPVQNLSVALQNAPEKGFYGAVPRRGEGQGTNAPEHGRIALWIGPEGGFSEVEIDLLATKKNYHYQPITIGNHILRIETAVAAGITRLLYM